MNKIKLVLIVALVLGLSACGNKDLLHNDSIVEHRDVLMNSSKSKIVAQLDTPYVGVKKVQLSDKLPQLDQHIIFKRYDSLENIVAALSLITNLNIQVAKSDVNFFSGGIESSGKTPIAIAYEGRLNGLLDVLSQTSGYGWESDVSTKSILFSDVLTKTFQINSSISKVSYSNLITNMSKEASKSSSIASTQVVSQSDQSSQSSQSNRNEIQFDPYEELLNTVKSLLTTQGQVAVNRASGSITVRDSAVQMRQIENFINDINAILSRQIAMTVKVWSLQTSNNSDIGFDLSVIFGDMSGEIISIGSMAGNLIDKSLQPITGISGSATAGVIDGKLSGTAMLNALKKWGDATQVVSAGGIIMANQPFPVTAVKKTGYLAGVSTSQGDYGQQTELTPGEVTTGFAMTIIPNILDNRKVVLDYNINLSSLDEIQEFGTNDMKIQLPQVSNRSLAQKMTLKLGQTLVLAGFEQENETSAESIGIFSGGKKKDYSKSMLIITIELESAEV